MTILSGGYTYQLFNNKKYPIWRYDIDKEHFKLVGDYLIYRRVGSDKGFINRRKEGLIEVSSLYINDKRKIVIKDSLPKQKGIK